MTKETAQHTPASACYFTEQNASLFRNLLKDKESYCYRIKVLWTFRSMLRAKLESEGDLTSNPTFPLLDTINELIGCLLVEGIHFDSMGNPYNFDEIDFARRKAEQADEAEAESNVYIQSLNKAFKEFVRDECKGYIDCDLRFIEKVAEIRGLYPNHRAALLEANSQRELKY